MYWVNYSGKLVRYGHIEPGHVMPMNTYVTHPWIARDSAANYLMVDQVPVFHPAVSGPDQADDDDGGSHVHTVNIDLPGNRHCPFFQVISL
jgi:hypothetical protein